MGIVRGSATLLRYKCSKENVDPFGPDIESGIRNLAAQDIEHAGEETSIGWVAPTHLLDTDITLEKIIFGNWLVAVTRTDRRKVANNLLQAYTEVEVDAARRAGNRVSRADKLDIKDRLREELTKRTLPTVSGVDFAWNLKTGDMFLGSSSSAANDSFVKLFRESFGYSFAVTGVRDTVALKLGEEKGILFDDLLPARFDSLKEPEVAAHGTGALPLADDFAGQEFLTWLMFCFEKRGGELRTFDDRSVAVVFEDQLVFCSSDSEGQRSILRRGTPTNSAEAATALASGRLLERAKVTFADSEEQWTLILASKGLEMSSVKLPKSKEREMSARIQERCDSLQELAAHVDGLFCSFMSVRLSPDWESERSEMARWVEEKSR